jgi:DNA-binding response OmpR family regulator
MQKIYPDMPDLIIADIMVPFFTGLEIVNIVKNKPETKNIPIIMLSAADMEETVLEAFKLGANDYVTKPFSPNELSTRVKKLLNQR